MNNTGEQFIPGISSKRLFDEHFSRYEFAKLFCIDKDVLDIACGTGYGSNELAKVAKFVTGVDISNDSIKFANSNYKANNLSYVLDDAIKLQNINKKKFDVVVSFETIEHLNKNERNAFLKNIRNLLKDNGIFILSTPNKIITSPFSEKPLNKFHVIEFTKNSLEKEISEFFKIDKFYGQRFISSFFTIKLIRVMVRVTEKLFRRDFCLYTTKSSPKVVGWDGKFGQPRIIIVISQNQ